MVRPSGLCHYTFVDEISVSVMAMLPIELEHFSCDKLLNLAEKKSKR